MTENCTDLFARYREICRLVWNLGFWPHDETRRWDSKIAYSEAVAKLFEGMVMRPLRCDAAAISSDLGRVLRFSVAAGADVEILLDSKLPGDPLHVWGDPVMQLGSGTRSLRFVNFFDWDVLAVREFRFLEVLIENFEEDPGLVGHHGLIEFEKCTVWLDEADFVPSDTRAYIEAQLRDRSDEGTKEKA